MLILGILNNLKEFKTNLTFLFKHNFLNQLALISAKYCDEITF